MQKKNSAFMFSILVSLSMAHGFNDSIQSVISAMYPVIKSEMALSYAQVGMVIFTYQISSSIMQPIFGYIMDKKPSALFLPFGMCSTMIGIAGISLSPNVYCLMASVFFSGIGSSVIHPEASKITSFASGGKRGLAQSIFQVGGSTGYALDPLLAAMFLRTQSGMIKFALLGIVALFAMLPACRWYYRRISKNAQNASANAQQIPQATLPKRTVIFIISLLMFLVFSKNFYTSSISSYYTFYLMHKFSASVQTAQTLLFVFLFSAALGTLIGGPLGDKYGRRLVIWWSILGSAPFALLMPYANFGCTIVLSAIIGFIMSSAFSAILVYAQELMPHKVGLVSGIFFGFSFGMAGIASATLGKIADVYGIEFVYSICAFLPLLGIVAYFLPKVRTIKAMKEKSLNKPR